MVSVTGVYKNLHHEERRLGGSVIMATKKKGTLGYPRPTPALMQHLDTGQPALIYSGFLPKHQRECLVVVVVE